MIFEGIYSEATFIGKYPSAYFYCKDILDKEGSSWYFSQCYWNDDNEMEVDWCNNDDECRGAIFLFDKNEKFLFKDLNNID